MIALALSYIILGPDLNAVWHEQGSGSAHAQREVGSRFWEARVGFWHVLASGDAAFRSPNPAPTLGTPQREGRCPYLVDLSLQGCGLGLKLSTVGAFVQQPLFLGRLKS